MLLTMLLAHAVGVLDLEVAFGNGIFDLQNGIFEFWRLFGLK